LRIPFRRPRATEPAPQPVAAPDRRLLSRRHIHQALRFGLAGGNLAFGVVAAVAPAKIAAFVDEPEEEVGAIARRDLAAGMAVLAGKGRLIPLLAGIVSDLREVIKWLRRKPLLAIFPIIWVALGIGAVLTRD